MTRAVKPSRGPRAKKESKEDETLNPETKRAIPRKIRFSFDDPDATDSSSNDEKTGNKKRAGFEFVVGPNPIKTRYRKTANGSKSSGPKSAVSGRYRGVRMRKGTKGKPGTLNTEEKAYETAHVKLEAQAQKGKETAKGNIGPKARSEKPVPLPASAAVSQIEDPRPPPPALADLFRECHLRIPDMDFGPETESLLMEFGDYFVDLEDLQPLGQEPGHVTSSDIFVA